MRSGRPRAIVVCNWRIQVAEPSGFTMWFDPTREVPKLESLPSVSEGFDELEMSVMEPLEGGRVETPEGGGAGDDTLPF